MNDRIKELRKFLKETQEEFSSKINLSRNFVAQIESGNKVPSDRTVSDICRVFSVNEEWLRTGKGEMFIEKSKDEQIAEMLADIQTGGEDTFKHRLISALSKLDKDDWESLEKLIDLINKK